MADAPQMTHPQTDVAASNIVSSGGFAPWVTVSLETQIESGIYEVEGNDMGSDPELPEGQIEIYDHPVRGQSYWDDDCDDGSDFSGHVSTFFLLGKRIRRVLPNQ